MVEEGALREGKNGGLVVCYRGAWLPQVIVILIADIIVIDSIIVVIIINIIVHVVVHVVVMMMIIVG